MDPRLVERGKMRVIGMIYYGENKSNEIAGLWQRFNPGSATIRNAASEEGAYGVCFNDVSTHRGPLSEIGSTYQQIYGTWLPASGYALAGPYDFEAYGPDFDPTDEAKCVLEIWVPVKP